MTRPAGFVERLVAGALAGRRDDELFGTLCDDLAAAGVPLLRAALGTRFLHPTRRCGSCAGSAAGASRPRPSSASPTARRRTRNG